MAGKGGGFAIRRFDGSLWPDHRRKHRSGTLRFSVDGQWSLDFGVLGSIEASALHCPLVIQPLSATSCSVTVSDSQKPVIRASFEAEVSAERLAQAYEQCIVQGAIDLALLRADVTTAFTIADYDGGLPSAPEPQRSGLLALTREGNFELQFSELGSNGSLSAYELIAEPTGGMSCRVTIAGRVNGQRATFLLSTTSAEELSDAVEDAFPLLAQFSANGTGVLLIGPTRFTLLTDDSTKTVALDDCNVALGDVAAHLRQVTLDGVTFTMEVRDAEELRELCAALRDEHPTPAGNEDIQGARQIAGIMSFDFANYDGGFAAYPQKAATGMLKFHRGTKYSLNFGFDKPTIKLDFLRHPMEVTAVSPWSCQVTVRDSHDLDDAVTFELPDIAVPVFARRLTELGLDAKAALAAGAPVRAAIEQGKWWTPRTLLYVCEHDGVRGTLRATDGGIEFPAVSIPWADLLDVTLVAEQTVTCTDQGGRQYSFSTGGGMAPIRRARFAACR